MKKLLYSIALVALFGNYGFAQTNCNQGEFIEFTSVPIVTPPSQAGTFLQIKFKIHSFDASTGVEMTSTKIVSFTATVTGGHTTIISTNSPDYPGNNPLIIVRQGVVNLKVNSPNSPSGADTYTITAKFVPSPNTFNELCTIADIVSINTTPIELLAFSGKQNNEGGVHLDWVTASEKNNAMFLVERSNNGNDFSEIGQVKGAGNSSKNINYSFNDASASNDAVNYYRLTDVDLNGAKTPSRIISVVVGKNAPLSIYTISAQQGWVSVVSPIAGDAVLNITNAQGQVMSSMKANLTEGDNQVSINTANLNTGIYILSINNNNRTAQTKFFKN